MNIIKLNAIDSTNLYLKKLADENTLENYTVAVARNQTAGRGQMGTNWVSDNNKNLTFSMLVKFEAYNIQYQFYISIAVALAVVDVLKNYVKTPLYIKWPNDILAEEKKVSGILIENSLKGSKIKHSIIGIGLNVNQEIFPTNIGNVSSLKLLLGKEFETDNLLTELINTLKKHLSLVADSKFNELKEMYYGNLYMFNKTTEFVDSFGVKFTGKIIAVAEDGRLEIETADKKTRKFNLKEIKFTSRNSN